jgi:Ca2+-binding EF-hand superfamily protein
MHFGQNNILKLFRKFDKSADGYIDREEMSKYFIEKNILTEKET